MSIPHARAAAVRWSRWFNAAGAVAVLNLGRMLWLPVPGLLLHVGNVAFAVVVTAALATLLVVRRKARASLERLLAVEAAEIAKLHAPRVPDAGPDQCPVCGDYGLDALAADDEFMERGLLAKVVAYGWKRAHWDCAEFVPYKPMTAFGADADRRELRPTPLGFGVICTCRFCGEQKHAPNMAAGEARLIAHARACPERGPVQAAERTVAARPSWMSASEARRLADIEEARLAPCRPPRAMLTAWREQQSARIVEEIRRQRWL
jgi:hypothetical protein